MQPRLAPEPGRVQRQPPRHGIHQGHLEIERGPFWPGILDIALECAAHYDAAPATLIRAARDLKLKQPSFAMQVALQAIRHLVEGRGYEPSPLDIDEAVEHLMVAAARLSDV